MADGKGLIIEDDIVDATEAEQHTQKLTKQRRRALLLHLAGTDVQDIFSTLPDTGERHQYEQAITAFNKYFVPQVNSTHARHAFHELQPRDGELTQQFVTRLKKAAVDCEYGTEVDNNIRDAILWKCPSNYIKRHLLEEGSGLTLTRTIEIATQCEKIDAQLNSNTELVSRITTRDRGRGRQNDNLSRGRGACYRCGAKDHYSRDKTCPAKGKTCDKCGKRDHFASVCRSENVNFCHGGEDNPVAPCSGHCRDNLCNVAPPCDQRKREESQRSTPPSDQTKTTQREFAFGIGVNRVAYDDQLLEIELGGVKLKVLPDSGAFTNIVDEHTWQTLKARKIKCISTAGSQNKQLYSYASEKPLEIMGTFQCDVIAGKNSDNGEFVVIRGNGVPLLGRDTSIKLGVMKVGINVAAVDNREQFREEFPEVFDGLGKLKDTVVTLHINPGVTSVAQPLRRTPFQMRERVESKLAELVASDIIEPVNGPTPWVNQIIIVPKRDGDIRLCIDMRRANEAIISRRNITGPERIDRVHRARPQTRIPPTRT